MFNPKLFVNPRRLSCLIAAFNAAARRRGPTQVVLTLSALLIGSGLPACGDDKGDAGGADCEALCSKPRSCPNDGDAASCQQECKALSSSCSAQASSLNSCTLARPETDFECDEAGKTKLKDGLCQSETEALFGCLFDGTSLGGGLTDAGSSGDPAPSGSPSANDSSGEGTPPSPPVSPVPAPNTPTPDSQTLDCDKTCAAVQQLGCDQTEAECKTQCTEAMAALAMSTCTEAYVALEQCAEADVTNNFECLDGAPNIKDAACQGEQAAFVACALSDNPLGETPEICTTFCATSTFEPPISCGSQVAPPCETNCTLVVSLFGDACTQTMLDYTGCSTKADSSHWSCAADGTAEFDGQLCQTEMDAVTQCVLGTP